MSTFSTESEFVCSDQSLLNLILYSIFKLPWDLLMPKNSQIHIAILFRKQYDVKDIICEKVLNIIETTISFRKESKKNWVFFNSGCCKHCLFIVIFMWYHKIGSWKLDIVLQSLLNLVNQSKHLKGQLDPPVSNEKCVGRKMSTFSSCVPPWYTLSDYLLSTELHVLCLSLNNLHTKMYPPDCILAPWSC